MELQLATTHDMLDELRRRNVHFAYAGIQNTNRDELEICYECQGRSRREILQLIRRLHERIRTANDLGAAE